MAIVTCCSILYFLSSPYFSLTLLKYQIQSAVKTGDTNCALRLVIKLFIFLISSHPRAETTKNGLKVAVPFLPNADM